MVKNQNGEKEHLIFLEEIPMHSGNLFFLKIFFSYLHWKTLIIKRLLLNHMIN